MSDPQRKNVAETPFQLDDNHEAKTTDDSAFQNVSSMDCSFVFLGQDTALLVDSHTGKIMETSAEGTLGIVMYGGDPSDRVGATFNSEKALRIPRLLQSDLLLNFHVAEIAYHEGRQARRFRTSNGVVGADSFYRFDKANPFTTIPGIPDEPCFVGFYLSPISQYELCLVSKTNAWPTRFKEYLLKRNLQIKDVFNFIDAQSESPDKTIFGSLLFLPDLKEGANTSTTGEAEPLRVISRETLGVAYAKKDVGGWWFNLPLASYGWMTANLERLLAGYVDSTDDAVGEASQLKHWKLDSWFQLLKHLTLGLVSLHQLGAIHGDPRPANIMTNARGNEDLRAEGFNWIDIGLGYGAPILEGGGGVPLEEKTTITPRPLGGGRTTPFYAPERVEAVEFEDADLVMLEALPSTENKSRLTFQWKSRTDVAPKPLPLLEGDAPVRELGKLKFGDRVQVREFLFEVEKAEKESLIISRIFEIFLDRVLIERKGHERQIIHERLKHSPISRYRIFQQWSHATDVYGLGIITLYLFFIRGLYLSKKSVSAEGFTETDRNPIDRSNREKIFGDLASLLRNQSFLESLLQNLKNKTFDKPESLWCEKVQTSSTEPAKNIKEVAEVVYATDSNFEFVWRGLNRNHGLFVQLIYFCLSCVWREDEVKEIINLTNFAFKPFCESRSEFNVRASKVALAQLEALIGIIKPSNFDETEVTDSGNLRILGRSREQQIITLKQDLGLAQARMIELERRHKENLGEAQTRTRDLLKSFREQIDSVKSVIDQNERALDKNKAWFGGIQRRFVEELFVKLHRLLNQSQSGSQSDAHVPNSR